MRAGVRTALLPLALMCLLPLAPAACARGDDAAVPARPLVANTPENRSMKIRLVIDGHALSATLEDGAAARDFLAQLPLTLQLEDYAATEKIAQLPRPLTTAGAPAGVTPAAGDLAFYAPWGNLAIFHTPFGYSKGLVRLGRIDGDLQALRRPGPVQVRIEPATDD